MSNVKDSSCEFSMLTLSEATKAGQLQDFIDEEEVHDTGPVDRNKVDKALEPDRKVFVIFQWHEK